MTLNIKYAKVYGVPVAPDAISNGSVSVASYPAIVGDYVITVNIAVRTYIFDLRGVNTALTQTIISDCDANAESLAKGQVDLLNPTGQGLFTFRGSQCLPLSYSDGGTINVAGTTDNYNSFQLTVLTNKVIATP
jgi:hypothetical protein